MKIYKNVNDGKWLTIENYNEMLEREIKTFWEDNENYEQENFGTFEDYADWFVEHDVDRDFELIEVNWLEHLCFKYGITRYKISQLTGLAQSTLSDIVNKDYNFESVSAKVIHNIALAIVKNDCTQDYSQILLGLFDMYL